MYNVIKNGIMSIKGVKYVLRTYIREYISRESKY